MSEIKTAIDALCSARGMVRMAEDALKGLGANNVFIRSAKQHVANVRAELGDAILDLRGEGKVD